MNCWNRSIEMNSEWQIYKRLMMRNVKALVAQHITLSAGSNSSPQYGGGDCCTVHHINSINSDDPNFNRVIRLLKNAWSEEVQYVAYVPLQACDRGRFYSCGAVFVGQSLPFTSAEVALIRDVSLLYLDVIVERMLISWRVLEEQQVVQQSVLGPVSDPLMIALEVHAELKAEMDKLKNTSTCTSRASMSVSTSVNSLVMLAPPSPSRGFQFPATEKKGRLNHSTATCPSSQSSVDISSDEEVDNGYEMGRDLDSSCSEGEEGEGEGSEMSSQSSCNSCSCSWDDKVDEQDVVMSCEEESTMVLLLPQQTVENVRNKLFALLRSLSRLHHVVEQSLRSVAF